MYMIICANKLWLKYVSSDCHNQMDNGSFSPMEGFLLPDPADKRNISKIIDSIVKITPKEVMCHRIPKQVCSEEVSCLFIQLTEAEWRIYASVN